MKTKGMSQTLALIVAASVLMMTALTVIFLTQGSLSGIGKTSSKRSCISTVQTQCATGQNTVSLPGPCLDNQGNIISGIDSAQDFGTGYSALDRNAKTIKCPGANT